MPSCRTNESSYKFGQSQAANDIFECPGEDEATGSCLSPSYPCGYNSSNSHSSTEKPVENTNTTACIDGYVNYWKHWCLTNTKECAQLVVVGFFPGIVYNATTTPKFHYDSEFLTGTWNFVNMTHPLHMSTSAKKVKFGAVISDKIRFYASADFQVTVNGKTGPIGHIPVIDSDNHTLQWCENYWAPNHAYPEGCTNVVYRIIDPNNIELTNAHGDVMRIVRLVIIKHLVPVN